MDPLNEGTNTRLEDTSDTRAYEGRPSVEARAPQTPRLQKKRSNAGANVANRRQTTATPADPASAREGDKTRKGSLRNAVRRIFGRRSKEVEPQLYQRSPPRHGYHRSEPTGVAPQPDVPEGIAEEEDIVQRTLSAPLVVVPSAVQRTRSPYAVEFPQSARLKPLNLGNPFSAPGSQLRRRKTLPSVLVSESDAATVQAAIQSRGVPPVPSVESIHDTPAPDVGRTSGSIRNEKRKSRSAGDLRLAEAEKSSLSRKRSDEIRYWRESVQGSVLRASGFRRQSPPRDAAEEREDEREEDRTPMAAIPDPFDTRGEPSGTSPAQRTLEAPTDFASPSALGSQLSQDLEDRVGRLEAGLQSFRSELAQLAANSNRRTVLIGNVSAAPSRRRASSGGRTASMLAETLQSDLEPSSYQYGYTEPAPARPSTSPQPPRTPTRFADPSAAVPAIPVSQSTADDPFTSTSPPPAATAGPGAIGNGASRNQPPQHTFRSLYEMLADERSARRRLETQMRGLRDEIANLNYQVSLQSNVQSNRSSYYASMDPMVGSSRLHALLAETEDSPPQPQPQRESGGMRLSGEQQPVVSRFSGSESEMGSRDLGDLETPHEAYQTPLEEQGRFPFGEQSRSEGEMF